MTRYVIAHAEDEVTRYVIAPARRCRDMVPADWQDRVCRVDGVRLVGRNAGQVQVEASASAVVQLRSDLGESFRIEQAIVHQPSG